jgi:hypothetical protein
MVNASMKILSFLGLLWLSTNLFGQSIWTNPITGTNPSTANPYTTGQTVDPNITASGIGRGTGIAASNANDRYSASGWSTGAIDLNDYFEFTISPNAPCSINFSSFTYTGQASGTGPTNFAFRSSIDGFNSNIGTPNSVGTTIDLSSATYQNLTTSITFRIYGFSSGGGSGTFSINSFTFNGSISCTSTPEIQLEYPSATNQNCGFAIDFGNPLIGTNTYEAFYIENTGNADLNIASFTISNNSEFTIIYGGLNLQPPFTLSSGSSMEVVILFNSATATSYSETLTIASDDANEGSCLVNLNATAVNPSPELQLQNPLTTDQNCGYSLNYGTQLVGSTINESFFITNEGTADLNVTDLQLSNNTDFSLILLPPYGSLPFVLSPGQSAEVGVGFTGLSAGNFNETLTIVNDDSNESSCIVNLVATAVAPTPNVSLQYPFGTSQSCGYTYAFGNLVVGPTVYDEIRIFNNGTADLIISDFVLSNTIDFSTLFAGPNIPPPITVPPGSFYDLIIGYTPTVGSATGTVTIESNDPDGDCIINLTGSGYIPAPELNLQTSSTNRACGYTHNFGSISTSSSGTVALTIQNTGTADMTISSLVLSGSADYTLNSPPATPLTIVAGGSQIININFNPTAGGTIAGVLTIGSNDSDEGTCLVNLTGVGIAAVPCSDLFFSEYIEGSSNNKYLEIYNPTNATIDLSNYTIRLYVNGSSTVSFSLALSGLLLPGGTFVIANNLATIYSSPNLITTSNVMGFNGDDAIELFNTATSSTLDIIGTIGQDPGAAWISGALTTADRTLIRNATVTMGVLINPSAGFPTLSTEWTVLAIDNVSNLGIHNASSCISNNLTISALSSLNYSVSCTTNDAGSIDYSYSGTFNSGNTLTLQLSDPFGNFASPTTIFTTTTTTTSGTINFTIPVGTTAGTGYRIRLISSNPSIITANNGSNITIVNTDGGCIDADLCAQIIQFQVDPQDGANGTPTNTGEFVQVCNVCTESVDISCYLLCFTDNNAGDRRGECFRIPSGTILAPGECYLMGGNGTTTATDPAADWDGASVILDLNWHTCGTCVSPLNGSSGFIGVLNDGGEDITFFNETGNLLSAVTYGGSGGANYSESFTIGASGSCPSTPITIPSSASHLNVGSTPSADAGQEFDEGWLFDCATQSWFFADADFSGGSGDTDLDLNPNLVYGCPLVTPLPVELYAFNGYRKDDFNEIYWITNTERNNSHFTLYRSLNGLDFDHIATIQGAGNSTQRITYTYSDPAYNQGVYYKLEQHDLDGNSKMYGTIYLPGKQGEFNIFPNPSSGRFTLNIAQEDLGEFVYIYDALGKLILDQMLNERLTLIELAGVNPGIYVIQMGSKFEKIIIR